MRFLNISIGIFCLYAGGTKLLEWILFSSTIHANNEILYKNFEIEPPLIFTLQYIFIVAWAIILILLLGIWIWAWYKQKVKVRPVLAGLIILLGTLMHITDSIDYSVNISDTVVGSEIIEQKGLSSPIW